MNHIRTAVRQKLLLHWPAGRRCHKCIACFVYIRFTQNLSQHRQQNTNYHEVIPPGIQVQYTIKTCEIPWFSNGLRLQNVEATIENNRVCYRCKQECAHQRFPKLTDVNDTDSLQGHVTKVQASCSQHPITRDAYSPAEKWLSYLW